jgi:hypothetical protein
MDADQVQILFTAGRAQRHPNMLVVYFRSMFGCLRRLPSRVGEQSGFVVMLAYGKHFLVRYYCKLKLLLLS